MTAKILLLCTAGLLLSLLLSCTTTDEDSTLLIEIEEELDLTLSEPEPEPEPDYWTDGTITITVGRFKTKRQLLNEMKKVARIGDWTEGDIMDEKFSLTPEEEQYTIEIAAMPMLEVGITTETPITSIRERYKKGDTHPSPTRK